MKGFNSIKEMRQNLKETKSGVAGDTIFSAKAIYFIAKKIDELIKIQRGQYLGDFQLFMSYKLKVEGISFEDALKQWRNNRGRG